MNLMILFSSIPCANPLPFINTDTLSIFYSASEHQTAGTATFKPCYRNTICGVADFSGMSTSHQHVLKTKLGLISSKRHYKQDYWTSE